MPHRELLRTIAIAGCCLALPIYNWHYIIAPSHRTMTLLVLSVLLSGALFYELAMRDAPMGWALGVVLGVMCLATLTWIVLRVFTAPLANDHAPLLPARNTIGVRRCAIVRGGLQIIIGGTGAISANAGPLTPFRVGGCPGPTVTRTARGVIVNAFGYDDDGTVIYRVRNNQFELLQGDYLHIHRTDRSTLALYDRWENEILYLRYLDPNTVRIRGRFLCNATGAVTIGNDELTIQGRRLSLPPCIPLSAGRVFDVVPKPN